MTDDIATDPLRLETADGLALEAETAAPPDPWAAVVLAHPHPLHGGDMRSLVTSELFRRLPAEGVACLRFNFRGVGASEGAHGNGQTEVHDIEAAVAALADRHPVTTLSVAGWSFGADVSLCTPDERIAGWSPIAPPLHVVDPATMPAAADPRPKLLLIPEHDQFNPPDRARQVTAGWSNATVEEVPGADHFLIGRTDAVTEHCIAFLRALGS